MNGHQVLMLCMMGLMLWMLFIVLPAIDEYQQEEIDYLAQGTPEEQLNIKKAIGWYENEYGIHVHYNTPEEVYEAYYEYMKYRNLTEEEFPIYDFRGDVP